MSTIGRFCLAASAFCLMGATDAPPDLAAAFGAREDVEHIDLSPDGKSVVFLAPGPGRTSVAYVSTVGGGHPKPVLTSDGAPERLQWCGFVTDSRLICQVHASANYQGQLIPATRLFAIGIDGKNVKPLGQSGSFFDSRLRQFDAAVLDWLPGQAGAVLLSRDYVPEEGRIGTRLSRSQNGLAVDRVDTATLKKDVVEPPVKLASGFLTDGRGRVRIMEVQPVRGPSAQLTPVTRYHYRPTGSSQWKEFSSYDSGSGEGTVPIAVDAGLDAAYTLKKLNGRWALHRVKLDGTLAGELVYSNDKVDVDDVVRVGRGQRVVGVTFAEETRQTVYFDPEYAKLAASLSKAMPKLPLVRFLSASVDGSKLLLFAGSDADPGRYYIYDKTKRGLNEIMLARSALEQASLARVKAVSYAASDGVSVPGYLTLPPGKESAKGLPAIVLPHGGPAARDEWGFDWLAQYFASRGYAVLQPNYRGSAGYGDSWLARNGFRGWRTSIGDVTAGAKWLVAQGVADPNRLAVVGWSYGGYAALQSGTLEPGLFKAIVAIAPVTDLAALKAEAAGFTNADLVARYVGTGPHIREGSPLQNASRIAAPVLLFHGDKDLNVGVQQSQRMHKQLLASGKTSSYVEFPGLDHGLTDSTARTRMLRDTGAFLDRALAK